MRGAGPSVDPNAISAKPVMSAPVPFVNTTCKAVPDFCPKVNMFSSAEDDGDAEEALEAESLEAPDEAPEEALEEAPEEHPAMTKAPIAIRTAKNKADTRFILHVMLSPLFDIPMCKKRLNKPLLTVAYPKNRTPQTRRGRAAAWNC